MSLYRVSTDKLELVSRTVFAAVTGKIDVRDTRPANTTKQTDCFTTLND